LALIWIKRAFRRPKGSYNKDIAERLEEFKKIFHGKCHCGCGEAPKIAQQTRIDYRTNEHHSIAGLPRRYVTGHTPQTKKGQESPFFKGMIFSSKGYVLVYRPEHPRATKAGYVHEHVLIMEEHLGRPLYKEKPGKMRANDEVVHHRDEVKHHNLIDNLQLMAHAEHMALHYQLRMTAAIAAAQFCN
jgi:hypothetical protein